MSTEPTAHFDLESLADDGAVLAALSSTEADDRPLIRLVGGVGQWERIKQLMPQLRSANVAVCLSFKKGGEVSEETLTEIFAHLRLWDQFTLHNLLELSGQWLAPQFLKALSQEARFETKWFEEWSTAAADTRLHKYPNLPWRRFIRKANHENYQFFTTLLEEWGKGTDDEEARVGAVVAAFLKEKRKAVNIAPKRFNKKETNS